MTKKDYWLIVNALIETKNQLETGWNYTSSNLSIAETAKNVTLDKLVGNLSARLKQDNIHFDTDKFVSAYREGIRKYDIK